MVVPGSLSALAVVAQALVGRGDRALVESPGYPNAHEALRRSGARRVGLPMDVDGWDLDAIGRLVRETRPQLAYLIPDFQNPTGNLMSDAEREQLAAVLRRSGTVPVVDEAHQPLVLDGTSHAAAVRVLRARDRDAREHQQELLGRPPDRVGALSRRRARAADGRPGRARPGQPRARAAGRGAAARASRGAVGGPTGAAARAARRPGRRARGPSCPTGASGCRAAVCRCGASSRRAARSARARPPSCWRPSAAASWCLPGPSSPSTVDSTRSCACRSRDRRTSCGPPSAASATRGRPSASAPTASRAVVRRAAA